MTAGIEVNHRELSEFCRRNSIRRYAYRVPWDGRHGARAFARVWRPAGVDLRTAGELSPYFRDEVLRTASVRYAAA
jgi:hypothetical protein